MNDEKDAVPDEGVCDVSRVESESRSCRQRLVHAGERLDVDGVQVEDRGLWIRYERRAALPLKLEPGCRTALPVADGGTSRIRRRVVRQRSVQPHLYVASKVGQAPRA